MTSVSRTWGTTPEERLLTFPCDRTIGDFDEAYYRGVSIQASPEIVFRWLCQMRVAPYSYDWIDNLGRQSPRRLIPGLEKLEIGQEVMIVFELVEFQPNRHITIHTRRDRAHPSFVGRLVLGLSTSRLFPAVAVSYVIIPRGEESSRLLVKLVLRYPRGLTGRLMRPAVRWGDLVMMRRQLLNFRQLAERTRKELKP